MRETESFLIAAQNPKRTSHSEAKFDNTQQNSKCGLRGDSERSKLAQREYKTRNDGEGKTIHWELCKRLKFDHTNKWYLHKPESVLENETHKIL